MATAVVSLGIVRLILFATQRFAVRLDSVVTLFDSFFFIVFSHEFKC